MKIVFLDVKTIGEDIDLSAYDELGEVVKYSFSSPEEVPARVTDADVIILNKVPVNEQTIGTAKNLKLVCVTATGTNNQIKSILIQKELPGEMLPATLQRLSHNTHLQCFSFY